MFLNPSVTYIFIISLHTMLVQWQKWATLGDDFSTKVLKDLTLTTQIFFLFLVGCLQQIHTPLEDLLTYQNEQVMIYYGEKLDNLSKGKPVCMVWSRMHDDYLSISTNSSQ
jgi:hypothetical protein